MMNRRVVVTGLGMVSPIGNDVASSWQAALEGKSGIDRITAFDASAFGCQIAGEVKDFDAGKYLGVKEVRRFDRFVHFGVSAGIMALEDSGLEITDEFAPECGCAIGSGIGGLPLICTNNEACNERGPRRISPFLIPGCIINMTSGQLAIMKNLKGPNIAHVTACSTGLHAIGEAMHIIARGDATVMVAGGCESTIHPVGVGGFDNMHALSRRNDDPKTASRPFDKDRDGFVMGEGAGASFSRSLSTPAPAAPTSTPKSSATASRATPSTSRPHRPTVPPAACAWRSATPASHPRTSSTSTRTARPRTSATSTK